MADLQVALDAARGLRDLAARYPAMAEGLVEVAEKIEERAWERERRRLGIPRRVEAGAG